MPPRYHFLAILISLGIHLTPGVLPIAAEAADWITQPSACPAIPPGSLYQLQKTYNGRVYLRFPNYTVYATHAPQTVADAIHGQGRGNSIVYRNNQGLAWDGQRYFEHPAYRREIVTRNHLANRTLPNNVVRQPLPIITVLPPPLSTPPRSRPTRRPITMSFAPAPWIVKESASSTTRSVLNHHSMPSTRSSGFPSQPTERAPVRPTYCGSVDALSTATVPLTDCH